MSWDLLQVFQAVSETGSLSAAGRKLGLSQPTVGRRISALEAELGERLFERRLDGLRLTRAGGALHPIVEAMGSEVDALDRQWHADKSKLSGTVRISGGEWSSRVVVRNIARLRASMPDVEIEVVSSFDFMNLSRREADIGLRNALPEAGDLITRLIARSSRAAYASKDYAAANEAAMTENRYLECRWVGYDDSRQQLVAARWLEAQREGRPPELRCTSSILVLEATKAGAGLALLPRYVGDQEPDLVPVSPTLGNLQTNLWLVYHADGRNRPAVMAMVDALTDLFSDGQRHSVGPPDSHETSAE
ncbi:MAG: LysR family transcriptional regulator [Pseudomonadota bacterium]